MHDFEKIEICTVCTVLYGFRAGPLDTFATKLVYV